jgi:RNA polymerase sigma-70 factor (ECF subfamily)
MSSADSDLAGFSTAWEMYRRELIRFLQRQGLGVEDAEELVQETYIRALREGLAFRDVRNPRAWLFQVAKNLLVDRYRWTKPVTGIDSCFLPEIEVAAPDPVDSLARCLPRVLASLTREDSDALVQCDLLGVTQVEFAWEHRMTVPAAKSRVQRARQRLRDQLVSVCRVRFDATGRVCCFVPLG